MKTRVARRPFWVSSRVCYAANASFAALPRSVVGRGSAGRLLRHRRLLQLHADAQVCELRTCSVLWFAAPGAHPQLCSERRAAQWGSAWSCSSPRIPKQPRGTPPVHHAAPQRCTPCMRRPCMCTAPERAPCTCATWCSRPAALPQWPQGP